MKESSEAETTASSSSDAPAPPASSASSSPANNEYGKGVVFYVKDQKIVGVLLWNVFNRVPIAREIINQGQSIDDIAALAKLFKIHE
jgi:programmed cell death 8 (apoptosis-inducing factor)